MKGINIDNNKISINPYGFNPEDFAVPEKITQAPSVENFEENYVPPVSFDGGFGNPAAFEALQNLIARREAEQSQPVEEGFSEMNFAAAQTEMLPC